MLISQVLILARSKGHAGGGGTVTTTPLSEWKLDETSGTTFADSRPAAVPMTITGTWSNLATGSMVLGFSGTSAYHGTGAVYATLPANNAAHALSEMTLSLYYQRNSALLKHTLLTIGDGTQAGDLRLDVFANGMLHGYHTGQDGNLRRFESTNGVTGTNLAVGVAHRIDLSFGPLGAKLYLDGVFLPNAWIQTNTNAWNNTLVKYIGAGVFGANVEFGADGAFDEVRLWDSQLSDTVIAGLNAAQSIVIGAAVAPVAVNFNAGDLVQNTGVLPSGTAGQSIDVLGAPGTFYSGVPAITIDSQTAGLGAIVDTTGTRPKIGIPTPTLFAAWTVNWTLTHTAGPGLSSSAVLSGRVVAAVVTPNLVSEWKLDLSSGSTFVDSGPANIPMTLQKTWQSLTLPSMVAGLTGTSVWTGASGAYATIPANQAAHSLSALTLSFYYQRNSALARQVLFAVGSASTAAPGDLSIEVQPTGQLRGYHVGGDGALDFFENSVGVTGTNLVVGTAYRITLSLGPAGVKLYLDNTLLTTASNPGNTNGWNNALPKYLAVFSDGVSNPADAVFDEIRLWDRQLSDAEVAALAAAHSISTSISTTVVTDRANYVTGDTITVTVTSGPGAAANAVGLYGSGVPVSSAPTNWKYLASNNQTLPGAGVTGGSVTFPTTGVATGSYLARLTDIPFIFVALAASADSLAVPIESGPYDVDVLANDGYTGTPTISIVSQTVAGMATVVGGTGAGSGTGRSARIHFQSNGAAIGVNTVTYQLTADGNTGSVNGTLTLTMQALGAPVAVADNPTAVTIDTGVYDIDVLANDTYAAGAVPTISITSQTGPGTATVVGTGAASRIRIPTTGLSVGTKTVTYQLTSDKNAGSASATLTIVLQAASSTAQVGLWHFAETSGLTFADSAGTNTATLTIPSWTVQTHVLNRKGIATGTDHALEVSNGGPAIQMISAYKQAAMSLVVYVAPQSRMRGHQYWDATDERFGREVIAWCDDGTTPGSFAIYRRYTGTNPMRVLSTGSWALGGYVRNASGVKTYFGGSMTISGASLPVDTAKRIVLTQGAAGAQLYLDGILVASIAGVTNGWSSLTNAITLGSASSTGHANDRSPLWGRLDECAVYTSQLSLAQVQALPAAAQSVVWKYPGDFVGGTTDINIANFAGNPQGAMDAAHAAGRYVYQNTNDATVYTGPKQNPDTLVMFKPNCRGMVGVKLKMYASSSKWGRLVLMGTPEGSMAGHGDRYSGLGGYKFIGCDFDNNARSNNWSPNGSTTFVHFDLEQQACFKIDSTASEGRFTVAFDACDFRDSCGDAVNGSSYVNMNFQSCRFYGCFRGPVVPGYIGQMTVTSKTYESFSDNSFGQLWGCGFQDIEFDGAGNNMVTRWYDVWADGDFDEQNCGSGSSTIYTNSHTTGGGMDFVNNLFSGGSLNQWEQHYCTISYHKDMTYPQSVLQALMTGLGAKGAWYDNCVFLANGSQYNYHDSYIVTPVSTDQFAILYRSGGTQGRLITMDNCQWRVKNLPSGTPTGNVLGFVLPGLGTGQSIEFNNVTIDAAFDNLPFRVGGITVRWHNTSHERTGSSTIWSGAGATVAF